VGIVVLKRLTDAIADGDCIHAVGSAINNDGSGKVGQRRVNGQMKRQKRCSLLGLSLRQ